MMETCVINDSTTKLRYTDDVTFSNLDAVEFISSSSLLKDADKPLKNGTDESSLKMTYSMSETFPSKQYHPALKNEILLTPSPAPSSTYTCNLVHSASRKSSLQYKKISFTTQIKPSDEKRLTLLGKPIVTGVKCKQNVTYRYMYVE